MTQTALLAALLLASRTLDDDGHSGAPDVPLPEPGALGGALEAALHKALVGPVAEAIRRSKLPPYLGRKEVMDLTGWSDRKLSYLQSKRRLPYVKRGRTVLFRTADVEAFLMEGYVPAKGAPAPETTGAA